MNQLAVPLAGQAMWRLSGGQCDARRGRVHLTWSVMTGSTLTLLGMAMVVLRQ